MAYVAVKGGRQAIDNACDLLTYQQQKGNSAPLGVDQIQEQLYLGVDRIMSEGGLYAPGLAALALKQTAGDSFEAAFMLRAYRATKPRLLHSLARSTEKMRIIRRISAAFKEVPGGQILGPTSDYTLRLLDFELLKDSDSRRQAFKERLLNHLDCEEDLPDSFPKVVDILRRDGLLVEKDSMEKEPRPFDITRQSLTYPAPRSATLQALARGESGGMLTLAYSSMRGYGNVHPTIGELRVGYVPLEVSHPQTGEPYLVGEVKVTEAELVAQYYGGAGNETPKFTLGYGLCFGQNELKAISMAVLDRTIRNVDGQTPAEDQEYVLSHVDGIEAMGFCNHWKLPHYVDFQSDLDRLRRTQKLDRQEETDQ
ncbi:MAG: carbon-phosphorus lyase complex subunit PhnI [Desulfuromonadales bacterium]|nr:carbon-phosphorus lyase complex subunit PhnI [Desulfuromonadales bacterium]